LTGSVQSLSLENRERRSRSSLQSQDVKNRIAIAASHTDADTSMKLQQMDEDVILLEQQAELLVQELESRDVSISELTAELKSKLDYVTTLHHKSKRIMQEKNMSEQKLLESVEKSVHYKQLAHDLNSRLNDLQVVQSTMTSKANVIKSDNGDLKKRNDELQDEVCRLSILNSNENQLIVHLIKLDLMCISSFCFMSR